MVSLPQLFIKYNRKMNEKIKKNAVEGILEDKKSYDGCSRSIQDVINGLNNSIRPIYSLTDFVIKKSRDKGIDLDGNMLINIIHDSYTYYLKELETIYGIEHCTLLGGNGNKWHDGEPGPFDIRID